MNNHTLFRSLLMLVRTVEMSRMMKPLAMLASVLHMVNLPMSLTH